MSKTETFLQKKYDFQFNVINNKAYYKRKKEVEFSVLDQYSLNSIKRELVNNNILIPKSELLILLHSNFVQRIDPLKFYFTNLATWNKQNDYIRDLASTIQTTNQDLFVWAFKKWLVAMVRCAIDVNVTNQTALILSGKQGLGKSTWLQSLIPKSLQEYFYSGFINPENKDHLLLLSEMLLINLDELASLSKKNQDGIKEMITKSKITERRPYHHSTEEYIRRASFIGSANHTQILTDLTGNRRFLCFEVQSIDYNHNINLDDVYSQAMSLAYDGDFKFYFDSTDAMKLEENNEGFVRSSEEFEWLDDLVRLPTADDKNVEYLNASDIANLMQRQKNHIKPLSVERIGTLMTKRGFEKKKIKNYFRYGVVRQK